MVDVELRKKIASNLVVKFPVSYEIFKKFAKCDEIVDEILADAFGDDKELLLKLKSDVNVRNCTLIKYYCNYYQAEELVCNLYPLRLKPCPHSIKMRMLRQIDKDAYVFDLNTQITEEHDEILSLWSATATSSNDVSKVSQDKIDKDAHVTDLNSEMAEKNDKDNNNIKESTNEKNIQESKTNDLDASQNKRPHSINSEDDEPAKRLKTAVIEGDRKNVRRFLVRKSEMPNAELIRRYLEQKVSPKRVETILKKIETFRPSNLEIQCVKVLNTPSNITPEEIYFQKIDERHSLECMLRNANGHKQDVLRSILNMKFTDFCQLTHIYNGDALYKDLILLERCYIYTIVERKIWPMNLYMRLDDLVKYLHKNCTHFKPLKLTCISPRLLHSSDLVICTDFVKDLYTDEREIYEAYKRCWLNDKWLYGTPKIIDPNIALNVLEFESSAHENVQLKAVQSLWCPEDENEESDKNEECIKKVSRSNIKTTCDKQNSKNNCNKDTPEEGELIRTSYNAQTKSNERTIQSNDNKLNGEKIPQIESKKTIQNGISSAKVSLNEINKQRNSPVEPNKTAQKESLPLKASSIELNKKLDPQVKINKNIQKETLSVKSSSNELNKQHNPQDESHQNAQKESLSSKSSSIELSKQQNPQVEMNKNNQKGNLSEKTSSNELKNSQDSQVEPYKTKQKESLSPKTSSIELNKQKNSQVECNKTTQKRSTANANSIELNKQQGPQDEPTKEYNVQSTNSIITNKNSDEGNTQQRKNMKSKGLTRNSLKMQPEDQTTADGIEITTAKKKTIKISQIMKLANVKQNKQLEKTLKQAKTDDTELDISKICCFIPNQSRKNRICVRLEESPNLFSSSGSTTATMNFSQEQQKEHNNYASTLTGFDTISMQVTGLVEPELVDMNNLSFSQNVLNLTNNDPLSTQNILDQQNTSNISMSQELFGIKCERKSMLNGLQFVIDDEDKVHCEDLDNDDIIVLEDSQVKNLEWENLILTPAENIEMQHLFCATNQEEQANVFNQEEFINISENIDTSVESSRNVTVVCQKEIVTEEPIYKSNLDTGKNCVIAEQLTEEMADTIIDKPQEVSNTHKKRKATSKKTATNQPDFVPQLRHHFRPLPNIQIVEHRKDSNKNLTQLYTASQELINDLTFFNNSQLLNVLDAVPNKEAQEDTIQVNAVKNITKTSINSNIFVKPLLYRRLLKFDYFTALTPANVTEYELPVLGMGQQYMQALIHNGDRKTLLTGDQLAGIFSFYSPQGIQEVRNLMFTLAEFHYNRYNYLAFRRNEENLKCGNDHRVQFLSRLMFLAPCVGLSTLTFDSSLQDYALCQPWYAQLSQTYNWKPPRPVTDAISNNVLKRMAEIKRDFMAQELLED